MRKIRLLKEPKIININEFRAKIDQICRTKRVNILYLFGGIAKGRISKLSDIDLAFYSKKEFDFKDILDLQDSFVVLFKRDDIDLVDLRSANPLLSYKVIKDGILLFCSDEELKRRLEYNIIFKYLNTTHLRKEFHRNLVNAVLGGNFYA